MKIQMISNRSWGHNHDTFYDTTSNNFDTYDDNFDKYDLIIVDLNDPHVWEKESLTKSFILSEECTQIKIDRKILRENQIMMLLPQNFLIKESFKTNNLSEDMYWFTSQTKYLFNKLILLEHSPTIVEINKKKYSSDFILIEDEDNDESDFEENILFQEEKAKYIDREDYTVTAMYQDNSTVITLNIKNWNDLNNILDYLYNETKVSEIPKWIEEIIMFDDDKQLEIIQLSEQRIKEQQELIEKSNKKLDQNKRYKSILYSQSDELVEVVTEMFEEMLEINLAGFVDMKKEDLSFAIGNDIFIVEIKGLSSNIKMNNLSQLDRHYTDYIDEHPDVDSNSIYKLLVVNAQRNDPVGKRKKVHESQIDAAKRKYGQLIIETSELLKLYEKYKNQQVIREEIIIMLKNTGKLSI